MEKFGSFFLLNFSLVQVLLNKFVQTDPIL